MRVRPLHNQSDVRALTIAHGRAWRAAYDSLLPPAVLERVAVGAPDDERVIEEYDRLAGYGEDRVFVAEDDSGSVRGYAVFRWGTTETADAVRDGEAELKELYVDPDYWGQGYGSALLEAGIDRLPDDVDALSLEVLDGNDIGINFYESRGFEPDGRSSFEVAGQSFPTRVYRRRLR